MLYAELSTALSNDDAIRWALSNGDAIVVHAMLMWMRDVM